MRASAPLRIPPWLLALCALGAGLALLVMRGPPTWPERPVLEITNDSPDSILVDARWWAGGLGVDGPLLRALPAGGRLNLRPPAGQILCVRAFDVASGTLSAGALSARTRYDTLHVGIHRNADGRDRPGLDTPCPPHLAQHRVRVAIGTYFDPEQPGRLRRESLIRRY